MFSNLSSSSISLATPLHDHVVVKRGETIVSDAETKTGRMSPMQFCHGGHLCVIAGNCSDFRNVTISSSGAHQMTPDRIFWIARKPRCEVGTTLANRNVERRSGGGVPLDPDAERRCRGAKRGVVEPEKATSEAGSSGCIRRSQTPPAPSAASATTGRDLRQDDLRRDRSVTSATTTVAPIWSARARSGSDGHGRRRC
jgi:hypothetical protein